MLNAKRFEYAIKRNIDPATESDYADITDEIRGAPEWRNAQAGSANARQLESAVGIKALHSDGKECSGYNDGNCDTLRLSFSRPAPYFHTVMSLWIDYPAKEENIAAGGDNWWNSSKYQVGNGPYLLKTLEPYVRARFAPNPNYWGGLPKADILYAYITDPTEALAAYKKNDLDIIGGLATDLPAIKADARLSRELLSYTGSCTFAIMFHQLKPPFTDQKIREAFIQSFDRVTWVRDVLGGLGQPTLTWIPPGFPGYDSRENRLGYDSEAARKALASSSYGSASNLPPIKLTFSDTSRNRTRNEWLAQTWKRNLGVEVTLEPVASTTYATLSRDATTAPQTLISGWCADYPDPYNWLSVYWRTGAYYGARIGYSNDNFDRLVEQADVETDPTKRAKLYDDAQKLLIAGAPAAMAWNTVNNFLVKPWITGITPTPMDSSWPGCTASLLDLDVNTTMSNQ